MEQQQNQVNTFNNSKKKVNILFISNNNNNNKHIMENIIDNTIMPKLMVDNY